MQVPGSKNSDEKLSRGAGGLEFRFNKLRNNRNSKLQQK
jgi:hypothetical protein